MFLLIGIWSLWRPIWYCEKELWLIEISVTNCKAGRLRQHRRIEMWHCVGRKVKDWMFLRRWILSHICNGLISLVVCLVTICVSFANAVPVRMELGGRRLGVGLFSVWVSLRILFSQLNEKLRIVGCAILSTLFATSASSEGDWFRGIILA